MFASSHGAVADSRVRQTPPEAPSLPNQHDGSYGWLASTQFRRLWRLKVLVIEYDVTTEGMVELVALINAVEEDGADPGGEAWLAWRRGHEDAGMGCAPVPPEVLTRMEATEDPDELRAIVETVILADRRAKEELPS